MPFLPHRFGNSFRRPMVPATSSAIELSRNFQSCLNRSIVGLSVTNALQQFKKLEAAREGSPFLSYEMIIS